MSEFNIHAWKKNQYLAEAGLGSSQAQSLARLINDAIVQVDDTLSYRDFAIAVGIVLKEEYGSHNFEKFMDVLHAELGIKESLNENFDNTLGEEFEDEFGFRAYADSSRISIMHRDDIDKDLFEKMIQWVESKGYKVDKGQSDNMFDWDDDRYWYPRIQFSK